jgi:hypothetical protein
MSGPELLQSVGVDTRTLRLYSWFGLDQLHKKTRKNGLPVGKVNGAKE